MSPQRLASIKAQALTLHRRVTTGSVKFVYKKRLKPEARTIPNHAAAQIARQQRAQLWEHTGECSKVQVPPPTWLRKQDLIRVSLAEHQWLVKHAPNIAAFTRIFEYERGDYKELPHVMSSSRAPVVREYWIGARTLSASSNDEDDDGDTPEGFRKSATEQEESAEITEMMLMLYDDPKAWNEFCDKEAMQRVNSLIQQKPRLKAHRIKLITLAKRQVRQEYPHSAMIEDAWGELRPIRPGDVIVLARGSNDDLDQLFNDEADDPREQNDFSADGSDHRYSDRYRANNDLEYEFLHDSGIQRPYGLNDKRVLQQMFPKPVRRESYTIPNTAMPEGTRWMPDEMTIRRLAQQRVAREIEQKPHLEASRLERTDQMEQQIRLACSDVRFNMEGKLEAGYFVNRAEFFASIEENFLRRRPKAQRPVKRKLRPDGEEYGLMLPAKEPPPCIDWPSLKAQGSGSVVSEPSRLDLKPNQRWIKVQPDGSQLDITGLARNPIAAG